MFYVKVFIFLGLNGTGKTTTVDRQELLRQPDRDRWSLAAQLPGEFWMTLNFEQEKSMIMPQNISIFRTAESKAEYYAAYEAMLKLWPVPYEELYIPTRFGKTNGFSSNHLMPLVYSDEELRRIHTPMVLLIGDHEVIYNPQRVIQRATRLVPGLQAEIIPNANHNAQVTAPEFVNQRILEFLKS